MRRCKTVAAGSLIALMAAGACFGNPKPKVFGDDPTLAPTVELRPQEYAVPLLVVEVPRPAYVNAFLVTPGEETLIIYPAGPGSGPLLQPGTHELNISFGQPSQADTGRILRRPAGPPRGQGEQGLGAGAMRSWIMVYASQDSVPMEALRSRVMGFTIPGYTDEALNTVARTVRSIAPAGSWAAVAVEVGRE